MNREDSNTLFSERQRFTQVWLWILLLGLIGVFIFGIVQQVILGHPFGSKPGSDGSLIIGLLIILLVSLLMYSFRLETDIKSEGIYVRFAPFHRNPKFYPWNIIQQSYIRRYNPILEYGGWGLRGLGKNRALNVSGNKGIQLVMQDGLKLLIGTKHADEATEALKRSGHLTK